jgi:uncharacterized membrane protein
MKNQHCTDYKSGFFGYLIFSDVGCRRSVSDQQKFISEKEISIMATLTVLKFPTAEGAGNALDKVKSMQKMQIIELQDAAIVTWPEGRKSPKTKQLVSLAGVGGLQGAFWGMLFGMIFFVPFFGMALGAAMGALGGHFGDYGIDDAFINEIRKQVTEGTSALFLMTGRAVVDKVVEEMKGLDFEIIATNLSKEEEEKLQAAFSEAE